MRQTTLNPPDFRRITLKCKKRWKKPHVQFDAYQRELQRVSPSNTGTTQLDGRHTDADVADAPTFKEISKEYWFSKIPAKMPAFYRYAKYNLHFL